MSILSIRWVPALPPLVLAGAVANLGLVFATDRFGGPGGVVLLLLGLLGVVVFPPALLQAARKCYTLGRQLTWWHGLWLVVFLSGLVFRVRGLHAIREAPVDAWAAYRIILVSISALVLGVRLTLRQTEWIGSLFQGLTGALAIYALVSAASTMWSVYPAWTLYKSLEYLGDVALLAAILATIQSTEAYKSLLDWVWVLVGGLLITVWAGAILWPEEAFIRGSELLPGRISGVSPALDQNTVGEYAAVLAIVAMTRLRFLKRGRGGRAFYWMVLAGGLFTLVLSQTRTAIVGFLLGVLLVLFFSKRSGVIAALILIVVLLLWFTHAGDFLWSFWERGDSPEGLATVSGRLPVWEFAWEKFQQRPLSGFGAYAGGRFATLAELGNRAWSSTLNAYVEVLVGTGIWGLIPLLVALLGASWLLIRTISGSLFSLIERQLAVEAVGVLSVITTRSFFTINLVWHHSLIFLVLVGYAEFLRRSRKHGASVASSHLLSPVSDDAMAPAR